MSAARFIVGDTRAVTATLPDGSVDLILTSPPFLALRSYLPAGHPDKALEIGSEATPAEFLDVLLLLAAEWRRVLAPHGSIAVELGDTYSGSGGAGGDYNEGGLREGQEAFTGSALRSRRSPEGGGNGARFTVDGKGGRGWPLPKSLCGIPHLFHLSLAYGRNLLTGRPVEPWRVRNVVAWCRPNPPVGALGDKFRPATSYMTIACPSSRRYFDLDAVRTAYDGEPPSTSAAGAQALNKNAPGRHTDDRGPIQSNPAGAPPLDWWEIPTQPYKGSHYATWPERLCERPIKAMVPEKVCTTCGEPSRRITERQVLDRFGASRPAGSGWNEPETRRSEQGHTSVDVTTLGWTDCGHGDTWRRGIVLDPFAGSGTTLAVATGLGRDAIGIDIDERNADLASERVGMFLTVERHNEAVANA